ncbi:MAG: hypothetical protein WC873_03965 [Candidatus Gracilibacteria bacterium]
MPDEATKAVPETPEAEKPKEGGFWRGLLEKIGIGGDRKGAQDAAAENLAESKEKKDGETLIKIVETTLKGHLESASPLAAELLATAEIKNGTTGTYEEIGKFFDERIPKAIKLLEQSDKYKEFSKALKESGLKDVSAESFEKPAIATMKNFVMQRLNAALNANKYNPEFVKLMDDKVKFSFKFNEKGEVELVLPQDFNAKYEEAKKSKDAVAVVDMTDDQKIEDAKRGWILSHFVENALRDEYFKEGAKTSDLSTVDAAKMKELEEGWKVDEKDAWLKVVTGQHWTSYIYSFICYLTNGESYPWAREPYEGFRNEQVKQGGFMAKLLQSGEKIAKPLAGSVGVERARGESVKMKSGELLESWQSKRTEQDKSPYYLVNQNGKNQIASLELTDDFKIPAGIDGQYEAVELIVPSGVGRVEFGKEVKGVLDDHNVERSSYEKLDTAGSYLISGGTLEKGTSFPTGTKIRLLTKDEAEARVKEWKDAKSAKKEEEKASEDEKPEEKVEPVADAPADGAE